VFSPPPRTRRAQGFLLGACGKKRNSWVYGLPAKLPPSQYWLVFVWSQILATRLPSQRRTVLDGFGIAMLMPSVGIAKYYRRRSVGPIKINRLARGRDAAILHRITKCARPVTLVRRSAPFMRLWDAPIRRPRPPGNRRRRAARLPGFVPKLLRFDESRGTLSLGLQGSAMSRAHAVTRIAGRHRCASAPVFSACNLHIR
jgi:hypothetical protein